MGVIGGGIPGTSNGDISPEIAINGPSVAVKTQMRVYNNLWLGLRVGAACPYTFESVFPLFCRDNRVYIFKGFFIRL